MFSELKKLPITFRKQSVVSAKTVVYIWANNVFENIFIKSRFSNICSKTCWIHICWCIWCVVIDTETSLIINMNFVKRMRTSCGVCEKVKIKCTRNSNGKSDYKLINRRRNNIFCPYQRYLAQKLIDVKFGSNRRWKPLPSYEWIFKSKLDQKLHRSHPNYYALSSNIEVIKNSWNFEWMALYSISLSNQYFRFQY